MSWLKKKIQLLLTYPHYSVSITGGGQVLKSFLGRRPRFITIMMVNHPWWLTIMAIVIAVSIFVMISGNYDLFARMGAVNVLVGVVFANRCISSIHNELESNLAGTFLEESARVADEIVVYRINNPTYDAGGTLSTHSSAAFYHLANELRAEAARRIEPYRRMEIWFASIGTLQWAFGDRLLCWVSNFWSNATC